MIMTTNNDYISQESLSRLSEVKWKTGHSVPCRAVQGIFSVAPVSPSNQPAVDDLT